MGKGIKYFVLLLLTLAGLQAYAVEGINYKFRTLSPEGGFYYDGVKSIRQDADGFIWVLMDNDIQRFDGYTYKKYYRKFKQMRPASRWRFDHMDTDSGGNLYVSTSNGVFRYDRLSDTFELALEKEASYFAVDGRDNFWIEVSSRIYRADPVAGTIDTLTCEGRPVSNVTCSHSAPDAVYMGTWSGRIYRYDFDGARFSVLHTFPEDHYIRAIASAGNTLWVLTSGHGLYGLDRETAETIAHYQFTHAPAGKAPARDLLIDKNGLLWVATQFGVRVICPKTGDYTLFEHSQTDRFSLPNNSVWSLYEDRLQNIWAGTFSGGLCMAALDEPEMFRAYTPAHSKLNHNMVSAFAEDGQSVWIGTEGGGVSKLHRPSQTFTENFVSGSASGPTVNNIKSLAVDPSGNLWIAMFLGGLDRYDPRTGKFTNYRETPSQENTVLLNNLREIVRDGDKGLWIIYQSVRSVVTFYSFADGNFTHHYFDNKDNNYYLFDILKGAGSDLWIVSSKNLYRFDTETKKADNVLADSIPYLNGQALAMDSRGDIWVGTMGNGIIRYRPSTGEIERIEQILDLDISAVYSILADVQDKLWMGTDNGLVMYDPGEGSFHRFDETDGLQGRVYYPLACRKTSDGVLYFGGTNGFSSVKPDNIIHNHNPPRIVVSEFLLDNLPSTPVFRGRGGYLSDEIVLPHSQTNFGFTISSDNYVNPPKNSFRYRLMGYDERWVATDALSRNVVFTKVPAGRFTFEVQAANNDGVWGPVTTVRVYRRAAPWASNGAYLLYTLFAGSVVLTLARFYRQRKQLQLELYKDKLDKQQKEEIHQSQLRFFTNISHDFRTPLSLILGVVDNLRGEGAPERYYRLLHSNAQRLLNLVNELMDFKTLQHGKMQLQVGRIDINRLGESIASDFDELARQKGITFLKKIDPRLRDPLYADRQVVEKILMNLLNNAFKYTGEGGEISFETYRTRDSLQPRYPDSFTVGGPVTAGFVLAVRDSGVGISGETIGTVFDRYYNVKTENLDAHLGTGIGLALVKSLVLLHKGSITIYSARDKGTDMVVELPSDPTVYTPDEFAKSDTGPAFVAETVEEKADREMAGELTGGEADGVLLRERKRILVVEDNDDLRRLLADFLSAHYDIEEAPNGWVAARYLEDHEVNLVISDIMMPVKDGITLCRELKADVNTSHIPFIMLTAKTGGGARLEGAESGADVYFEKPIDFNLLLLTVRNVFNRQEKLREHYSKNYFVDSAELAANENDNAFLKKLVEIIEANS